MRTFIFLFSLLFCVTSNAQVVTISGYAPAYVGKTINAYKIVDYFSNEKALIASGTVADDSTFSLSFDSAIEQKIILESNNNKGFLLVQPEAQYRVHLPEKDKYTPYKPTGNDIEIGFLSLDSTDINYKVLGFQRWVDHFIGNNYHLKSIDPIEFVKSLDRFKTNVEKAYAEDSSIYLKAHIRFSIASLDNIPNAAERNRYEKYDFYLRKTPVYYNCEAYMVYVRDFYQKLIPRLSAETALAVEEGIQNSSPTLIMRALGTEYTMSNIQLRELIMINTLADIYGSPDYPQKNIMTVLDSLSQRSLVPANQVIAKNLIRKVTQLLPGGVAPEITLNQGEEELKSLKSYAGKHIYIHFMNPESLNSQREIPLLQELHAKYGQYVQFLSIYKSTDELSQEAQALLSTLEWDTFALPASSSVWKDYQVESFPLYTLIDATGYIVASPALTPLPNGQYQTIDQTFFYIKKAIDGGY